MTEKKKNPTGLRMNEEKLKFVMEKEGLSSRQKVVNFLLDKYWWEQKIGAPPTLERQVENESLPSKPLGTGNPIADKLEATNWDEAKKKKIQELEDELPTVPENTSLGKRRIAFLKSEIYRLKTQK